MSHTISLVRFIRADKTAISGAPITTPNAYVVIAFPAAGMVTWSPSAILVKIPMVANSVVPMVNPPKARARRENGILGALVPAGMVK